ncbi:u3 small nucleolar RNA-associated protein 6 homolog [Caerostris darwini]|uniref:U3 small nucleolar RNA-associated protein 6 homolog n=1 Tax=Caerostris darwini TaxID=1538125 RepID=A0AAV4WPC0_9ARAC|nr:u3 small nucleolar RNA-associated protein 6 homolog [Caerostris darwini]
MAELVHLRLEHTLPELEEMERIGLCNRKEIRSIVKKRNDLEYKLRRKQKRKEDFLKYIEYEMNLLNLVAMRRERLLCESKKTEIDTSIAKRINRLFKGVISRYPEDEKLWLDQIQFCKEMKWYDTINALQTRLLQVHSKNPSLWVMAAKWEMEETRSPENARKIFQRGVLINPLSSHLWREYFRMELMYIDLIHKRRAVLETHNMKETNSDEDDAVLNGQIANIVYDKAIEAFDDIEYALSFIEICLDFEFGRRHIEYIFKDVTERFPEKEETLDALAKRPLLDVEDEIKKGKKMGIKKRATIEKINQDVLTKYEEAVKGFPTEKMWSYYIEYLLSLLDAAKESKITDFQNMAISAMESAAAIDCLKVDYYTKYVDLLFSRGDTEEALSISIAAARKFNTEDLWLSCLTFHIRCSKGLKKIYKILIEAIKSVDDKNSCALWKLGVDWLSICDPRNKLVEFLEMGIQKPKEISTPLKEMYLELCALNKGIEETRALYKRIKKLGPLPPSIVNKMIKIEKSQLNSPISTLRKYYEDGIHEFGSESIDIWLDYMKLEAYHAGGDLSNYGILYWRAKKALKAEHLVKFQFQVMDLTKGCDVPSSALLIS